MDRLIFVLLFLSIPCFHALSEELSRLLTDLDYTIKNQQEYIDKKEEKINALKQMLAVPRISAEQLYKVNLSLFQEYKFYKCDSAIRHIDKCRRVARVLNGRQDWIDESSLHLSAQFAVTGMYKESLDILQPIDSKTLSVENKKIYFNSYKRIYSFLSFDNLYEDKYKQLSNAYRDSLLSILRPGTPHHTIVYAEKLFDENQTARSRELLLKTLERYHEEDHQYAIFTHSIAKTYLKERQIKKAQKYFALSAIADIKNAVKENVSLQFLASSLYEENQIKRAYAYIHNSLEDAIFCNARLRTVELTKVFPIIDTAYKENVTKQKNQFRFYLILTGILAFLLIIAVVYVFRQMKKTAKAREELRFINTRLEKLNTELKEANHVKEQYIGNFLSLCSDYIDKMEDYRKVLFKKAAASQWDTLFALLKSTRLAEDELKELYINFDNIFLHIYPSFIEEFNRLLIKEERFVLKPGELLTPELRIFALLRLGIRDSSQIARFLRYSVGTIYNYRTKVRNKAAIDRNDFEMQVLNIGSYFSR